MVQQQLGKRGLHHNTLSSHHRQLPDLTEHLEWLNHRHQFDAKLSFGRQLSAFPIGVFPVHGIPYLPISPMPSSPEGSLFQRRRPLTQAELEVIPWLRLLSGDERQRAVQDLKISDAQPGDYVCRTGRPVTYWFGVVEGLLKMSTDNAEGQTMTFTGVPPGGWFGEGTALKREVYRYNIQALRKSMVAGLHVDTFHWLLDHSIGFNRFVMNQLNERLGQFIAAREIDRMANPNIRVARSLAALFNPVLYPGLGTVLRITQQELAYLVGLSRQRVNEALTHLAEQGAIQVEYGGLRVTNLQALRSASFI
jgi:CRP-like cAMP-binding protein